MAFEFRDMLEPKSLILRPTFEIGARTIAKSLRPLMAGEFAHVVSIQKLQGNGATRDCLLVKAENFSKSND